MQLRLLVAASCALLASAQTNDWPRTTALDALISGAVAESKVPSLSVSVTENGAVVYARAFGTADLERHRASDPNVRYAVGSISKEFTAAALLLLAERGKLSLDDKVVKYLPGLTRASEITIRELLSHTSGYEDYWPQDYVMPDMLKPITPQGIVDQWAKKPLNFDPGTKWQYSNTNYVIAGMIFEKVSGEPLLTFLRREIFDPLEIASAGDCLDKRPTDAVGYTRFALGPPRPAPHEGAGWVFAAGELCMTPTDLAKWDIAFMQGRILSKASYQDFVHEIKLTSGEGTHYALGLSVGESHGEPTISHGGEVSGFLAINLMLPKHTESVTVLSNEDGTSVIEPLAGKIAREVLGLGDTPDIAEVTRILSGLEQGRIDRSLFTSNANFYFSDVALGDLRDSLAPLGKVKSVRRTDESLRGGMTHRSYSAEFEKRTLGLNIFVMPDGKYEQFIVEERLP